MNLTCPTSPKCVPPIAYNDYGRKSTIYRAEGSHSDIVTITDADSLGQRIFGVNNLT